MVTDYKFGKLACEVIFFPSFLTKIPTSELLVAKLLFHPSIYQSLAVIRGDHHLNIEIFRANFCGARARPSPLSVKPRQSRSLLQRKG